MRGKNWSQYAVYEEQQKGQHVSLTIQKIFRVRTKSVVASFVGVMVRMPWEETLRNILAMYVVCVSME